MSTIAPSRRGFSTIVALLMTAFLLILTTGILHTLLSESRTSRALYQGIVAYAGAEGAMEYALLKVRNHDKGFSDAISMTGSDDPESLLLAHAPLDTHAYMRSQDTTMGYEMETSGTAYTGTIAGGAIEVIPLFVDTGKKISVNAKNPSIGTSTLVATPTFTMRSDDLVGWNLLGSDAKRHTYGIVGTGSVGTIVGNGIGATVTNGTMKVSNQKEFNRGTVAIADFLRSYSGTYLVLSNPKDTTTTYSIASDGSFSFPRMRIVSSGQLDSFRQNLEFLDNRSKMFEALKYSLFNR